MKKKTFEEVYELLLSEEDAPTSIPTIPKGVVELIKRYQDAAYKVGGPGSKPNRKMALTWFLACAVTGENALEKIYVMETASEDWIEKQRLKWAEYQQKKRAALAV